MTSASTSAANLPLAAVHRESGCQDWLTEGGFQVPDHYGNIATELAPLTHSAAIYDGSAWGRIEVLGADGPGLVHGFCTVNTRELEEGQVAYGLATGPKGQVLADITFCAHADRLWLRVPPGQGRALRDHLGKYVITEDAEFLPMGDLIPVWVLGPQREDILGRLGVEVPPRWQHHRTEVRGTEIQVENSALAGIPGVCLSVSASIADLFIQELVQETQILWVGRQALESARIAAGAARWAIDFDAQTLPQEAGLNATVDYEKGCYLGQEVVARLHYRGQEQRRLCAVMVEGAMETPVAVNHDGQQVGMATSISWMPDDGAERPGIAMIRRSAFATESEFQVGRSSLRVLGLLAADRHGLPGLIESVEIANPEKTQE